MKQVALVVACCLWATEATSTTLGLFTDSTGTTCSARVAAGGAMRILVRLDSERAVDSGEFRIAGLPSSWTTRASVVDPSARVSILGAPTGARVAFWQAPHTGPAGLFYLTVQAETEEQDVVLEIAPHLQSSPPPGEPTTCPWVHYADDAAECIRGGRFTINGSGDCFVSLQSETWSGLRRLYR